MRTEHKDIDDFGWNSLDGHEVTAVAVTAGFRVVAQQLNLIGHVLIDIREALEHDRS